MNLLCSIIPLNERQRQLLADYFELPLGHWRLLSTRPRHTHFVVRDEQPVVVRLSKTSDPSAVEAEAELTDVVRREGFSQAPLFLRGQTGHAGVDLGNGVTGSAYNFIAGRVSQPLDDVQFSCLVDTLPAFFTAMRGVDAGSFPGRREFPRPEDILDAVCSLDSRVSLPKVLHQYALDRDRPKQLPVLGYGAVIHGDLNASNLVWDDPPALKGIIDFESFLIGSQLLEIAALVTGSCFVGSELVDERLISVMHKYGDLVRAEVSEAEHVLDYLILTALRFFAEVNQETVGAPSSKIIWRDAARALELDKRREDLIPAIEAALH